MLTVPWETAIASSTWSVWTYLGEHCRGTFSQFDLFTFTPIMSSVSVQAEILAGSGSCNIRSGLQEISRIFETTMGTGLAPELINDTLVDDA